MTLAVITPTGGRPEAFGLLRRWMKSQSYGGGLRWVVATNDDHGYDLSPVGATDGGSAVEMDVLRTEPGSRVALATNLVAACDRLESEGFTGYIAIAEDDDWYHPDYLMMSAMRASSNAPIIGESNARYYNVRTRRARQLPNGEDGKPRRHASLAQTVIHSDLLPLLREVSVQHYESRMPAIDMRLWERAPWPKQLERPTGVHVSVKGMPGASGYGIGHRDEFGVPDPWLEVFRAWGLPLEYSLYMEPVVRLGWLPARFDGEADVAIGMVARNNGRMTRDAITSVFATTKHLRTQVMLWDNGSTDPEALDLLDDLRDLENVRVFRAAEGAGWIRAINYMARFSTAPYFVGLNNDIRCHDGWADALVEPLKADPTLGETGPRPQCGFLKDDFHGGPGFGEPDYIEGWCFCVPRDVIEKYGPYDEHHLKMFYGDDSDLSLRLKETGRAIRAIPGCHVDHFGSATLRSSPDERGHMLSWEAKNLEVLRGRWGDRLRARRPKASP